MTRTRSHRAADSETALCAATTRTGKPCRAYALRGGEFCINHAETPEQTRERLARARAIKEQLEIARVAEEAEAEHQALLDQVAMEARVHPADADEADAPDEYTALRIAHGEAQERVMLEYVEQLREGERARCEKLEAERVAQLLGEEAVEPDKRVVYDIIDDRYLRARA